MSETSGFPFVRSQRLRSSSNIRDLVSENNVTMNDLVMPIFVTEDQDRDLKINKMPGIIRKKECDIIKEVEKLISKGIKSIALFPRVDPQKKNNEGDESTNSNNLICRCLRVLSKEFPNFPFICDVALDAYTLSGHDGLIDENGKILNDLTIKKLAEMSLNFARSGAKIIAPSDMMDGRIKIIRNCLEENKYEDICIISYSAKYCSELYKPFREALGSEKNLGLSSKEYYQLDVRNTVNAIRKIHEDILEGSDIIMVKPATFYLDIIKEAKEKINVPIAAYQVSGEYYMLKMASLNEIFNFKNVVTESLNCIKRAGASLIFSYFTEEASEWLKD